MNITVINGTEKHGITYNIKEMFLEPFRQTATITEFYLPKDCPNFCIGCTTCFTKDEILCKDADYIQKIEKSTEYGVSQTDGCLSFDDTASVLEYLQRAVLER